MNRTKQWLRNWLGIESIQTTLNELDPNTITPRKVERALGGDILKDRLNREVFPKPPKCDICHFYHFDYDKQYIAEHHGSEVKKGYES